MKVTRVSANGFGIVHLCPVDVEAADPKISISNEGVLVCDHCKAGAVYFAADPNPLPQEITVKDVEPSLRERVQRGAAAIKSHQPTYDRFEGRTRR